MTDLLSAWWHDFAVAMYPLDLAERLLVLLVVFCVTMTAAVLVNYSIRANERKRLLAEMRRQKRASMKVTPNHR